MIPRWYDTINTAHPEDIFTRVYYIITSGNKGMTRETGVSVTQ